MKVKLIESISQSEVCFQLHCGLIVLQESDRNRISVLEEFVQIEISIQPAEEIRGPENFVRERFSQEMAPVPVNLVFPDDTARDLLARSQLSETEAVSIIRQMCATPSLLSKVGFDTLTDTLSVQVEPAVGKQGDFSYTAFVTISSGLESKHLVAQFRARDEQTNHDVLRKAVSIFHDFVAIPLCLVSEYPLQLSITCNYGDTYDQQSHTFSLNQKRNAIRDYAKFLAMGCTESGSATQTVSRVAARFKEITAWSFTPPLSAILQTLIGKLGILRYYRAI